MLALLAALALAAPPDSIPPHELLQYELTIVAGDPTGHITGQADITWRITSGAPIMLTMDPAIRVVRVITASGPAGNRRGGWGRNADTVFVPQELAPGDTLITRIRFHGLPNHGLVATHGAPGGWFPAPFDPRAAVPLTLKVEVPAGYRPEAVGRAERVDTLAHGRTVTTFRSSGPLWLGDVRISTIP